MPFNGSGTFTRVYNWVTDKNSAINITASRVDTEDTGFATGLSNCICKDGQTTITANLPMGGFIHTGVGNATARNQYAVVGNIQDSLYNWIAGGGTVDAITATYSPAITALVDGMELDFRATGANATTTPTFSPNGLTAHTITQLGGSALFAGSISAANFEGKLRYNLANTRWELLNPAIKSVTNMILPGTTNLTGGQIQFPATQSASSDPNTLDDYEEGTWTPADASGATLSFTVTSANYVKIGKAVYVQCSIVYPATANGANTLISGLPFAVGSSGPFTGALQTNAVQTGFVSFIASSSTLELLKISASAHLVNSEMGSALVKFSGFYFV